MSKRIRLLSLVMRSGEFERSREAAAAIEQGEIQADRKIIKDPKHSIRERATIMWNGTEIEARPLTCLLLNKPAGVICQKSAKERTVYDLLEQVEGIEQKTRRSLFSVGRLDRDTTGLLVITNDGQLEHLLTEKEKQVVKTYKVTTDKPLTRPMLQQLQSGVIIRDDDRKKQFTVRAVNVKQTAERVVELGITEGKKRQVKKMLFSVGNYVTKLERVGIGRLRLGDVTFTNGLYMIIEGPELIKRLGI